MYIIIHDILNQLLHHFISGGQVVYRAENQPRDPRSFKSFVQSTSKSVVDLAQKAMKSFFPYVGNNKDLLDDQVNGLHMNRRSYIAGDKSNTYYANYFHNNQLAMAPAAIPYAQYYRGYPAQYMMNYPAVASAGNYLQPNQDITSKRLNVPQQVSQPSSTITNVSPVDKKSTTQQQQESATRSILDEINSDADGFFDAITNTKQAMVSDGKDGEMSVLETVEGNSNKDGIKATKKNKINSKSGKKNKKNTKKALEENYKRALKSQGELEKKLVNYFTDYICGNDC